MKHSFNIGDKIRLVSPRAELNMNEVYTITKIDRTYVGFICNNEIDVVANGDTNWPIHWFKLVNRKNYQRFDRICKEPKNLPGEKK